MITLSRVNNNPFILEFINKSKDALQVEGYTDHGLLHSQLVADRARTIAQEIGLSKKDQELSAVSGFCHDMANFMSRSHHHYFGALLFQQLFPNEAPEEVSVIMQAIANHDKKEMKFSHPVAAVLVIADKSDVRRSRVLVKDLKEIKNDIHDRVNYATKKSKIKIDKKNKRITLSLQIDAKFVPIIEYFEIFTERMIYCRQAAEYLGYKFGLIINNFQLL